MISDTIDSRDLLFELGTEEIPAKFMPSAISQMGELAVALLRDARIGHGDIRVFATPRRLALFIRDVSGDQESLKVEAKGPAIKTAYDANGVPTKAAEGFARGQGIPVSDLETRSISGVEYVFAVKTVEGQPSIQVLPGILESLVGKLTFPKPMRWGSYEFKFVRPIRWIVALFGNDVIPFEMVGVKSDRFSRGHRFLGSGSVEIPTPEDYQGALAAEYVMVDQIERKKEVWRQITRLASEHGGKVEPDEELLDEISYILEWPTALYGSVPKEYAHLPKPVITTPMKDHQRYFPVVREDGTLLPMFITVRNGDDEGLDNVRKGNEMVLNARLADARFFYDEDLKIPLPDRVGDLSRSVFHEKLGTVLEKTGRVVGLTGYLGKALGMAGDTVDTAIRAAGLCKADLTTHMVYEFTELQGIMGEEYALKAGESQGVARAISEHYMPRYASDCIPQSEPGIIVALADKIDSIAGAFSIGLQPTGSADPYGLRRQALGVCNILLQHGIHVGITGLLDAACAGISKDAKVSVDCTKSVSDIKEFIYQRLKNLFLDKGYKYDSVDAVLTMSPEDIVDAESRIKALEAFKENSSFAPMLTARNRASNLAKKGIGGTVDTSLFESDVEMELFTSFQKVEKEFQSSVSEGDYTSAMEVMARLERPLNTFFEGVMVMADDESIRENRLALLSGIASMMDSIADFGKIVE